jgi:hypothetical protein
VRRPAWVLAAVAAGGPAGRPPSWPVRAGPTSGCSTVPFDPRRAAALELEWWIVHREVDDHPPGDLEAALAELAAELYQVPAERLWTHAAHRAEAMTVRDRSSRREVGVLDDDWDRIEAVLWVAWKALADEVRTVRDAEAQEA